MTDKDIVEEAKDYCDRHCNTISRTVDESREIIGKLISEVERLQNNFYCKTVVDEAGLKLKIESLTAELASADEVAGRTIKGLTAELKETKKEIDSKNLTIFSRRQEIEELKAELEKVKKERGEWQERFEISDKRPFHFSETSQMRIDELEAENQELKNANAQLQVDKDGWKRRSNELREKVDVCDAGLASDAHQDCTVDKCVNTVELWKRRFTNALKYINAQLRPGIDWHSPEDFNE